MGDLWSKIAEMEDKEREQKKVCNDHRRTELFVRLYTAALTGVVANPDFVQRTNEQLVERVFTIADLSYKGLK